MNVGHFITKRITQFITLHLAFIILLSSCSVQKKIAHSAKDDVLNAPALQTAHVGISIYEPATGKYWYDYNGEKYFVPASNVKIPTCYAAMKYLGDSLVGLRYGFSESKDSNLMILAIQPTGDPTFLHPDFQLQPVWDFLSNHSERFKENFGFMDTIWKDDRWGNGWAWNDYDEPYMAERNVMPIFGNVIKIKLNEPSQRGIMDTIITFLDRNIAMFRTQWHFFDSILNSNTFPLTLKALLAKEPNITIRREFSENVFWLHEANEKFVNKSIPFVTGSYPLTLRFLSDSLKISFGSLYPRDGDSMFVYTCPTCRAQSIKIKKWNKIRSQPTDSVLKHMMHRSDNFFAEQSLLMVSNERLGIMNDEKIIDTLLKTGLKDLPQKPRWVDGSGLSRYNLFTPIDFVAILNKMKNEFGMERIKNIFPTGGQGTLNNYFNTDSNYIYAKTGTLSGVVALSGYLYTKKGKELIFSVLVNNHQASGTEVRRAVEKFLQEVRNKY